MQALQEIIIKGAEMHNLKKVDLVLPRNQFIVVTGVSGSGKSSLVFDTLYAEGHRRYVESLSSYARQFLARMSKPKVEYIQGLSPAIAIEQRVHSNNPRSTVGSITEIYDYLRLLYARVGRTYSPISGQEVTCDTVSSVVDFIFNHPTGTKVYILARLLLGSRGLKEELKIILQKGFTRLYQDGEILEIEDLLQQRLIDLDPETASLLVDRFVMPEEVDEDFEYRVADSVQTSFNEGHGYSRIQINSEPWREFSELFELDGLKFEKPTEQLFNFNNPFGACPTCEGFGRIMGIDESLVIPDPTRSVADRAVDPWKGPTLGNYLEQFIEAASELGFPVHRPYQDLSESERQLLWKGNDLVTGIDGFFRMATENAHKVQYRILLARYRGYTTCPDCQGSRLRREALYVRIGDYSIADFLAMSIDDMAQVFPTLPFDETDRKIATRILREITSRLNYLQNVGLGYLSLDRKAATLSGGESQRINLATSLGSNLKGSMYILDEPSIGLHPRDGDRLIRILESLRDLGNTVIVVEHDEAVMNRANFLVDMGLMAGEHGGEVIFAGTYDEILDHETSLTGQYLSEREAIPLPPKRRAITEFLTVRGAAEHNLKDIDVAFALGGINVVTGVSGSGKTTLVREILYPAICEHLQMDKRKPGVFKGLDGDLHKVARIEMVDQSSIGKNARSNPVTYVGAYDHIRETFASLPEAKSSQVKATHFSFNVPGGRCEACQGEGHVVVQMQFLPDVRLVCDVCRGRRFKQVVLEIRYREKNIFDVLQMSVHEALEFFSDKPKIVNRLKPLEDVGLGYLRLGQSSSTLSGGEAQRLKLASFLENREKGHTVYLFDEPTTGLHFHDIRKLLEVFNRLVERDNTVIIIEHNLDVIKCADWLIDLGPEGGKAGGHLLHAGRPEDLLNVESSYTAQYLAPKLADTTQPRQA